MINNRSLMMLGLALLIAPNLIAQDDAQPNVPQYVAVTTNHWNMDKEDFSMTEWKALQKEYFDKVTSKNEYIISSNVLTHYFTADNTEVINVATYASWENIDAAVKRSGELIRAAWPDSLKRREFFQKRNSYYDDYHSDEIYSTAPGSKIRTEGLDKEMTTYVRISKFSYPADGTNKEFDAVMKEFNEAVIQKNEYIKAYYPNYHGYGADARDFLEATICENLADVEKSFKRNEELINANWPDQEERKAFFGKMSKYFTGEHGDYVYKNIPELMK